MFNNGIYLNIFSQQYKNSITTNNQYRHKESEKLLEEIM